MKALVRRDVRGFTLIEMVLVLIILATVAGLVISSLGGLGRSADMAATAKNQQDLANQLSLYFVLQKRMPQRLDSLLVTGTPPLSAILPALDGLGNPTTDANLQAWGLPLSGANGIVLGTPANLVVTTLATSTTPPSDPRRSFVRLGFDFLMDHTAPTAGSPVGNCNNSGVVERDIRTGSFQAATVVEGSPLARQLYPAPTALFPGGGDFPDDVAVVVAVGIGPNCSLAPNTMLNIPAYPGSDNNYYGRYIAYFACFHSGERAQLVGVSDSYGRFPNYSIQQFHESLPNNDRQG